MGAVKTIPQQNLNQLMGAMLSNRADMVYLLNMNGVYMPQGAALHDVQISFLKAVKDSPQFRTSASTYITQRLMTGTLGFADNSKYLNTVTDLAGGTINTNTIGNTSGLFAAPTAQQTANAQATAASSSSDSGGSFWDTLGSIFTTDTLNKAVNVGLTAEGAKLQAQANQQGEQAALQSQALAYQNTLAQQQLQATKNAANTGMPGWGWALIGIGAVAIVGTVIVVLVKRSRARRAA